MKTLLFTTLALISITYFSAPAVSAQTETPCGNIIGPEEYTEQNSATITTAITNCSNPFGVPSAEANPFSMEINGTLVEPGSTFNVPTGGTDNYSFDNKGNLYGNFVGTEHLLYKKIADDYVYLKSPFALIRDDYEVLADQFFPDETDYTLYVDIILNQYDPYEYLPTYDEVDQYYLFDDYVSLNIDSVTKYPKLTGGEYIVVRPVYVSGSSFNEKSLFKKIFAFILPVTAYAQFAPNPSYLFVTRFTIVEQSPEPLGASSVLFLPGIMGSRLYEIGQQCGDFGVEQERWFSTTDCKQLRLLTGMSGNSLNDIYTKEEGDSVIEEVGVFNLYKTFFSALSDWKEEGVINDYALVPYDWRMRLDELLKTEEDATGKIRYNPAIDVPESYLYQKLEELAASSTTGKVTIVAHSNGGLLAKTFLATLQNANDPLLAKVDNVIMVAAPQLGTPSTLLGMLHGDEIGPYGAIVSQLTTRRLMNTMPFGFHLLPATEYFDSSGVTVDTPVITFESGSITNSFISVFGNGISNSSSLINFLTADSGRARPTTNDLVNPEVVPKYLFDNYTQSIHQLMSNWVPPESMKVYQVAGIGLPTQSGVTYFTDRECIDRDILKLFKCTAYRDKLGMYPNDVIDGDETVVTPSALAISDTNSNVERWWLNLDDYNSAGIGGSENLNRRHKDIFEVQDIVNFVGNTLQATTAVPYLYLTNTAPDLPDEDRLVFNLHSPLDLFVVTANGGIISSSSVTVEGAVYKRFGEMQHISMLNSTGKKTVVLNGESFGSFTLEIGEQEGGTVVERHRYSAIPSSSSTRVTMELDSAKPIEQAQLAVDYDGNGSPEIVYNTLGEVVPEVTYSALKTVVTNLSIKSLYKKLLLENIKIAEQYQIKSASQAKYKKMELLALNVLKQQVFLYERLKILTPIQKQELVVIIDTLLNK